MAKYTIELRKTGKVFNFEYDFYTDNVAHKEQFEILFCDYYAFHEIGSETVERFKHNLRTHLNMIMPYYKQLYATTLYDYNPIFNVDGVETETTINEKDTKVTQSGGTSNKMTEYDTPIKNTSTVAPSYVTENEDSNATEVSNTGKDTTTVEKVRQGNIGVTATQDLIEKERKIIVNINRQLIDELKTNFMLLY